MAKGSELDKQIYKEGNTTWGLKLGFLDVLDVRICSAKLKKELKKNFEKDDTYVDDLFKQYLGDKLT